MIEDIRILLDQYVTWLRDKTTLRQNELPRSKLRGIQTHRNEASFGELTRRD